MPLVRVTLDNACIGKKAVEDRPNALLWMNDSSAPVQNLDRLRSEGDLNLSPQRRAWAAENISG